MAKHKAHKRFGRMELEKQEASRKRLLEQFRGKTAILQTYEDLKLGSDYTDNLRVELRKIRVRLDQMGAL